MTDLNDTAQRGRRGKAGGPSVSPLVVFGWVGLSRVSMSPPLLFLAGLVGLMWAELDYQKYVSVFLCYSKNGKDVGGTCHWLGGVQSSYIVCRFLV